MTSGYHGSKFSGFQRFFLTETAICIVERWRKSIGYRFVPECSLAQESHICHFLSAIFAGPRFFEIPTFWQRDVTTSLLYLALKFVGGGGGGTQTQLRCHVWLPLQLFPRF